MFPFVFLHNPWTASSLAVFPLYPSNPSPRHLICYTCLHCFHQIIAVVTNFARNVPVLSSNSEFVLKTGLVFAYKHRFWHSIYQNRSEIFFGSVHLPPRRGRRFLFWSKSGHKILFSWSQGFCRFRARLLKIPQAMSFTCLSSFSVVTFFCAPKYKIQRRPKKIGKKEGQKRNNI